MRHRIVLAGNGLAAVYVLELLVQAGLAQELLVVAPPDTARGSWSASLAETAGTCAVPLLQPDDINASSVVAQVSAHRADLLLSVYYTQVFGPAVRDAVDGPALNFHPSLLPRHRGVAPLVWAIVEGDRLTGLTVHHVDAGIDTGPIVLQRPMPIHPNDTGYSLHRKMAHLVRACATTILHDVLAGREVPAGEPQAGQGSLHRRAETVNHLRWEWPAERIRNVVRALAPPLPGAFIVGDGVSVVVAEVTIVGDQGRPRRPPGTVEYAAGEGCPLVWAGDGLLRIDRTAGRFPKADVLS